MVFQITMKTPDVVYDRISSIVALAKDEHEVADDDTELRDSLERFLGKFFKNEECVTLEFDTVAQTATVVRR
jgi:hypothetical protein